MPTSTIEWRRPADRLPDDDTTVLASIDGEVFDAWLDGGDEWRDASGMPARTPDWWAHMPEAPQEGE